VHLPLAASGAEPVTDEPERVELAAFIQKPFTMPALLAEVRRVIARERERPSSE
jgi:DNA-binding response OmpR family regulator